MDIIWEVSIGDFLLVTVFLGGGAAWLTGRAVASTWRPFIQLVAYVILLTCATRFIHYALFGGTLISPYYFVVDLVVLMALALLGFRITRAGQMARQYSWIYERSGGLFWRERTPAGEDAGRAG